MSAKVYDVRLFQAYCYECDWQGPRPAVIPLGWLTAHDVSKIYRVSVQYARKMAHRHRWRRIRCGQHVGYHLDDVEAWSDTRETTSQSVGRVTSLC